MSPDWNEHPLSVNELLFIAADQAMTADPAHTEEQFLAAAQTAWREVQRDHGAEPLSDTVLVEVATDEGRVVVYEVRRESKP